MAQSSTMLAQSTFETSSEKVPPSHLHFHARLEHPIKLSIQQSAFVGATLKFIQTKSRGAFTYNVPGTEPGPDELSTGMYEYPHLTFVVEQTFVKTKEGQTPPTLGTEIREDPEAYRKRMGGAPLFEYNTEDTFTIALWSAYGDFTKWKCANIPAIRPFLFKSIILDQNFFQYMYTFSTKGQMKTQGRSARALGTFHCISDVC
jgi:hypothetical protein